MAALARLGAVSGRLSNRLPQPRVLRALGISTSKKTKDTVTVTDVVTERTKTEHTQVEEKNWISWGFDRHSKVEDNTLMHLTFFFGVTLCLVTTGFVWSYLPDYRMRDWAQREAYLELRRREALGMPAIDPNLIDPEKIELPADEELGRREIII